jgi:plasmid stabilization system protein ParE
VIPYTIHPEAEAEIDATAAVYEAQRSGLSASFIAAVERAVSFLRTYPEAGAPIGGSYRRVLVRRFPYGVIYRLDPNGAFIVAVAHVRRRPDYWRHRE